MLGNIELWVTRSLRQKGHRAIDKKPRTHENIDKFCECDSWLWFSNTKNSPLFFPFFFNLILCSAFPFFLVSRSFIPILCAAPTQMHMNLCIHSVYIKKCLYACIICKSNYVISNNISWWIKWSWQLVLETIIDFYSS